VSDHVGIAVIDAGLRRRMGRVRVGHFATTDGREPALVPVCFVVLGDTLYHAIDAKPKSTPPSGLRRVRNVRANPSAAFLAEHPRPAPEQIREMLAGTLCRCTGYQFIVDAVAAAARAMSP